jgi:nucleoside-diphosphate-sugar epimerase
VTAIVHVAGVAGDRSAKPEAVMATNVLGHVARAAGRRGEGVQRVVYLSSGKALGLIERDPDYLPVDDDHRGLPSLPYALSKWLAEEMCAAFSTRTGIQTLCLRPVQVFDAEGYAAAAGRTWSASDGGHWHLGVHIDVRDVASACAAALTCTAPSHERLLLSAADIAAHEPTRELGPEVSARRRVARRRGVRPRPVQVSREYRSCTASARLDSTTQVAGAKRSPRLEQSVRCDGGAVGPIPRPRVSCDP